MCNRKQALVDEDAPNRIGMWSPGFVSFLLRRPGMTLISPPGKGKPYTGLGEESPSEGYIIGRLCPAEGFKASRSKRLMRSHMILMYPPQVATRRKSGFLRTWAALRMALKLRRARTMRSWGSSEVDMVGGWARRVIASRAVGRRR